MDILDKILKSDYSKLFSNDKNLIEKEYKSYVKQVHPDINKDSRATNAFQKLSELKAAALKAISEGTWKQEDYIQFKTIDNKIIKVNYLYHRALDICEYYVCKERVIYVFNKTEKEKFYKQYIHTVKNLTYKNNSMRENFFPLFPQDLDTYETNDKFIISFHKNRDIYPLRAVIDNYWKGKVPGKHLAWITSRLMQILAYTEYSNIVINGIDIDSCFVSLKGHAVYLYGGWWFSTRKNDKMIGTTPEIYSIMPPKVKADKKSDYLTDIESVKYMLRALDEDCPDPIKAYYLSGSCENHMDEWLKWEGTLNKAYGERKFIKIEPEEKEIYLKE